jgi:hypothetical protein
VPSTQGSIGALGYDTWGGSWAEDCNKNTYILFDENQNGITQLEWENMFYNTNI